jgi:hypothetical protein
MKRIWTLVVALWAVLWAWMTNADTQFLISSSGEEWQSFPEECEPVLSWYKVSYFLRVPYPGQPGMYSSKWTTTKVEAYTVMEAAGKLGLKPGYNCFVSRQMRV